MFGRLLVGVPSSTGFSTILRSHSLKQAKLLVVDVNTALPQVQCEDGFVLQVGDDQIYSLKEKLPRKVQMKVKVCY